MLYLRSKYFRLISIKVLLLISFTLFFSFSYSQSPQKFYRNPTPPLVESIGIRSGFGVIIPHRESMVHLVTGHVVSTEIYLEKCGETKYWNRKYRYPTSGISLYHAYLS